MDLPNRHGRGVDPVPFFVVTGIALATCLSFGPMYFVALGLGFPTGVALSVLAFVLMTLLCFHRLVWTARPVEDRPDLPPESRLYRIAVLVPIALGLLVLLALPLVL